MKKWFLFFIGIVIFSLQVLAQFSALKEDSLRHLLKITYYNPSAERLACGIELMSRHLPDEHLFDSLKNILITEAETSRERDLICKTYDRMAGLYLHYYYKPANYSHAKFYADKCIQIASESGKNEYKVAALCRLAKYYLNSTQNQKALGYNNEAISLATSLGSDSLLSEAYASIAQTWGQMANKLSEFQSLLNRRDFAERSGIHRLMADSYFDLGYFYEDVGEYEKAKDFFKLVIDKGNQWGESMNVFYGLRQMGYVYIRESEDSLGIHYFNSALRFVDSLGLVNLKLEIYLDLLNYYFNTNDPQKGLAYLQNHPELMKFIDDVGAGYQVNKLYAVIEQNRHQYDSAMYFMRIAEPFEHAQQNNYSEKFYFTFEEARILRDKKDFLSEARSFLLAKSYADSSGNLYLKRDVALQLDSVYKILGDYQTAYFELSQYNLFKDSLETLGKQKDLLNIEVENTNKRSELQKAQDEARVRNRNNLEYLGITAAIATVFIILILFGFFKIPTSVISALGFFAFIFLFEFIVLLLDTQIHEWTHGEPWKILGIKIVIIGMLLPLHHWLEEKMLHYLTSRAHGRKAVIS